MHTLNHHIGLMLFLPMAWLDGVKQTGAEPVPVNNRPTQCVVLKTAVPGTHTEPVRVCSRFTAAQLHLHCLPGRIEVHKHNLSVSRCVVTRTALSRNHLRKGHVHRAPSHGVVQFVFFSVSMFCMRMGASALNATPKYVAIMTQVIKSSVDTLVSLPV